MVGMDISLQQSLLVSVRLGFIYYIFCWSKSHMLHKLDTFSLSYLSYLETGEESF